MPILTNNLRWRCHSAACGSSTESLMGLSSATLPSVAPIGWQNSTVSCVSSDKMEYLSVGSRSDRLNRKHEIRRQVNDTRKCLTQVLYNKCSVYVSTGSFNAWSFRLRSHFAAISVSVRRPVGLLVLVSPGLVGERDMCPFKHFQAFFTSEFKFKVSYLFAN
jgi:hypothetical protein